MDDKKYNLQLEKLESLVTRLERLNFDDKDLKFNDTYIESDYTDLPEPIQEPPYHRLLDDELPHHEPPHHRPPHHEPPHHEPPHHELPHHRPPHHRPPHPHHHIDEINNIYVDFNEDRDLLMKIFGDEDTTQAVIDLMIKSPAEIKIVLKTVIDLHRKVDNISGS